MKEMEMSVARVTEIIASSKESFEDAVKQGLRRASKTLKNVKGAWIKVRKWNATQKDIFVSTALT